MFICSAVHLLRQVHITAQTECKIPFGIGVASDPMALRRGAKKLPMEDVCYYKWPLPGMDQVIWLFGVNPRLQNLYLYLKFIIIFFICLLQFGLFGICDGHGGADAATSVSKLVLSFSELNSLLLYNEYSVSIQSSANMPPSFDLFREQST